MDLSYGKQYEDFRAEVQAFLSRNWPPKGADAELPKEEGARRFRARAIEQGYLNRAIPKQYGGSEQAPDEIKATIIREEFMRVHAPGDVRRDRHHDAGAHAAREGRGVAEGEVRRRRRSAARSAGARATASRARAATWPRSRPAPSSSATSG